MKKTMLFLLPVMFLFVVLLTLTVNSKSVGDIERRNDNLSSSEKSQYEDTTSLEVDIPSVDEVRENGYPTNDAGMTYGPDIKENTDPESEPDLILVCNEDGLQGYIRATDIKEGAQSLEEAMHWKKRSYVIPMYLHNGETVIGEYRIED